MIPHRLSHANNQPPLITHSIKRLSRKKQHKYNNARRTNSDNDWLEYCNFKKEIQKLCRTSHNNYLSSLLDNHNKCTKKFCQHVKSMRKEQTSIITLHYNGENSQHKANVLNNQFVSVFTSKDQSPLSRITNKSIPDISQLSINVDGVFDLLTKIDPHKAAGPDGFLLDC